MIDLEKEQARWDELAQRLGQATDSIGTPIDSGIMDVVVALNVVGVNTTASCEGHLDYDHAYPWVYVGAQGVESLEEQLRLSLETSRTASSAPVVRFSDETKHLRWMLRHAHFGEAEKLIALLDEFYLHHRSGYDARLKLDTTLSGECSLLSVGGPFQDLRSTSERAAKLAEYQEEMRAFGTFLKARYFANDHQGQFSRIPKTGQKNP